MTDTVTTRPPEPRPAPEEAAGGQARDTVARGNISLTVRFALWAKNAGRCAICNDRMLGEGRTYLHSINLAEMAHIRGATAADGSPRGKVEGETDDLDRESEENLVLLCRTCHRVVDDKEHIAFFTAAKLREIKARHELFVERATEQAGRTRTAVVTVGGDVRGVYTKATPREVMDVMVANNFIGLVDSQRSGQFPCDLPGVASDEGYWTVARGAIWRTLSLVHQAVEEEGIAHVSVFAIGPVPALVMLGAELDDKVETRVWQKHRGGSGWTYPSQDAPVAFAVDTTDPAGQGADAEEVVLVCSLSAEVDTSKLPQHLENVPVLTLRPEAVSPTPTLLEHEDSVPAFGKAFRGMLADAEKSHPHAKRWHLVGAMPVVAAVEAGRAFMRDAQPPVDVYQRTDPGTYEPVLTINDFGRDTSAAHLTGSRP